MKRKSQSPIGRLSACFPWHANASRLPHRRLPNLERPGGCCSAAAARCSTAIAARSRAAESGWLPSSESKDHTRCEQVSLAPVQLHPPTRPRCYVGGCVVALRSLADANALLQIAQAPACDALSGCVSRPRLLGAVAMAPGGSFGATVGSTIGNHGKSTIRTRQTFERLSPCAQPRFSNTPISGATLEDAFGRHRMGDTWRRDSPPHVDR